MALSAQCGGSGFQKICPLKKKQAGGLYAVNLNAHADRWRVSGMGVVKSPFGVFLYICLGRGYNINAATFASNRTKTTLKAC